MRKRIFLFLLLLPLFSYSQVNIINRSLTDSTLNIAYVGVDNEIELTGLKSLSNLNFSTTNGRLTELGQNKYVLKLFEKSEFTLSLKDKAKVIAQKTFKADVIPDPYPRFSSQYDSTKTPLTYYISFNNLIEDPVLRIEAPKFYFKNQWKIVSYRITLDGGAFNGTLITEFTVEGPEPTKEQVQKIRDHGSNTFMTVEDIRVIDPEGWTRRLVPIIINIK